MTNAGAVLLPKTVNNLFDNIVSEQNLLAAALELMHGKRRFKPDVLAIAHDLLNVVHQLHERLMTGTWKHLPYNRFVAITDVKRRIVYAPAAIDRVVHHAIMRIVHPIFIRKFIFNSYAITPRKGNQRAARCLQRHLASARATGKPVYVLKGDIHKFYPSMNHYVLLALLSKTIRDKRMLALWWQCIDSFAMYEPHVGLPVGSYLSQLSANVYLNPLDHLVVDQLGMKYSRYMDDFVVVSNDKDKLFETLAIIDEFLVNTLKLTLNPKTMVIKATKGVDFVGYTVFADHIRPRKRNVKNARNRLRALAQKWKNPAVPHELVREQLRQQVAAFAGNLTPCAAYETFDTTHADFDRWAGISP